MDYRNSVRKYSDRASHTNTNEFEADQYAANRVGAKNVIKALKKVGSLTPTQAEKFLKDSKSSRKIIADVYGTDSDTYKDYVSNIEKIRKEKDQQWKQLDASMSKDLATRKKVLNDRTIKDTSRQIY